ncbi:MAG TPA: hypothetical protein VM681_02860 [Candidatus Thermoplasmatota archaeon]|nr:hypothetical protein [Candidatus Thermoplasmatota archaeon]
MRFRSSGEGSEGPPCGSPKHPASVAAAIIAAIVVSFMPLP